MKQNEKPHAAHKQENKSKTKLRNICIYNADRTIVQQHKRTNKNNKKQTKTSEQAQISKKNTDGCETHKQTQMGRRWDADGTQMGRKWGADGPQSRLQHQSTITNKTLQSHANSEQTKQIRRNKTFVVVNAQTHEESTHNKQPRDQEQILNNFQAHPMRETNTNMHMHVHTRAS